MGGKKLLGLAVLAASIIGTSSGAHAGSQPAGSIEVAGAGASARAAAITYGSTVGFDTEVTGRLASQSQIVVRVLCWQGATVVYQYSAAPDFAFPLADQEGQNLEWDSSAASCTGELLYVVTKGRSVSITALDSVAFDVASVA